MTAGAPAAPDVSAVLAGLLHRPEWHQRAACSGMGTDGFVVRHCGRYRCRSGRSAAGRAVPSGVHDHLQGFPRRGLG